MRIRIERLRVWLLASAALLLVVLAGFIGAARYLRRHWMGIIPGKLGANVRIDSSGITKSFTHDGQTDYVIHAGKYVERKDGKAELHDVWMKLCGRKQQRADMVRGDDWEWDQKTGVIRAIGAVHIALRPAAGKPGCAAVDDADSADLTGAKALNVTTSNLVYMDKLGVAATSAPIEFQSGGLKGNAVGADYSSDAGTLMLHSAVSMTGASGGQPVELHAASAEMDGQQREVRLTDAKYVMGRGAGAHTAAADQAVLHLRPDQTLERIEAQGNVSMQANGGTVDAAKADVAMNAAGHAASAWLAGGVRYAASTPLAERHGEAEEASISFDGKASPRPQRAVFTGAVHFVERIRADGGAGGSRELTAAKLEVSLQPDAAGKSEVRDAEAAGGAKFSQSSAGAAGMTEIAADELKAHFAAGAKAGMASQPQLETIAGAGHTLVRQVDAKRVETTSAGDTLTAKFRPGKTGAVKGNDRPGASAGDLDTLAGAVQTGHVIVTRNGPAKLAKGNGEQRASAQQVSYDGSSDTMTLTGGVQLADRTGELWANDIALDRATGDARATGGVSAQYTQAKANVGAGRGTEAEPAHVLADRAELDHATDVVTFHGAPARMWQGGSQVLAPVIEMDKAAKRLIARGESGTGWAGRSGAPQVRTLLASADGAAPAQPGGSATRTQACAANAGGSRQSAAAGVRVVRIASGALVYSGILGEAEFTGGLRAETSDTAGTTTIRADSGTAWMTDKRPSSAQNAPSLEGNLDRMAANGSVIVDRPGLRATGERLLYTASDEDVLLWGDAANPPRATDARGSSTTGPALRLHRGCGPAGDTVEVLNRVPGQPGAPAGEVHTESRVEPAREKPRR